MMMMHVLGCPLNSIDAAYSKSPKQGLSVTMDDVRNSARVLPMPRSTILAALLKVSPLSERNLSIAVACRGIVHVAHSIMTDLIDPVD